MCFYSQIINYSKVGKKFGLDKKQTHTHFIVVEKKSVVSNKLF
jgi:hypothetical protein